MKKKDIIMGIMIIVIGLVLMFAMRFYHNSEGNQIIIKINGEKYGTYSLEKNQEIDIDTEYGHNIVTIENKKAYMKEADCPDGYCIHQGSINKGNQTIVCLPHKLVVEVKINDSSKDADVNNNGNDENVEDIVPDAVVK